jgi:N-acetyltransferase 10
MIDVQKMGYGGRAIDLLIQHFQGELSPFSSSRIDDSAAAEEELGREGKYSVEADSNSSSSGGLLDESLKPRAKLPPLMTPISELVGENLHWLGVSFGLTSQLLNFWSRKGFKLCYLRQTKNELTGEHSSVMLRELTNHSDRHRLSKSGSKVQNGWLHSFVNDYRRRIISLLSYSFSRLDISLAITLLEPEKEAKQGIRADEEEQISSGAGADTASGTAVDAAKGPRMANFPVLTANELLSVHLSHVILNERFFVLFCFLE